MQHQECMPFIQVLFTFKIADIQMEKKQLLEAEHAMRHLQRKLEEIIHIFLSIVLSQTMKTFKKTSYESNINFMMVKLH